MTGFPTPRLTEGPALIALVAALAVASCTQTTGGVQRPDGTSAGVPATPSGQAAASTPAPSDASATPAERRMREQGKAFDKTVWEGALLGAGTVGLAAVLFGDEAALLAALGGGAAGGLAGSYVAKKQKQFANQEDVLNSMTADVRNSNAATLELIASVREVIAEDQRRLAAAEKQVRSRQAAQAEVAAARRRMTENKAVIVQASRGAKEKKTMFQGAEKIFKGKNPASNTAGMEREIEAYSQNIQILDGLAQSIASA